MSGYHMTADQTAPARRFQAYTPSANEIPNCRGVWAEGAGTVTMTDMDDNSVQFTTTGAGLIPVIPKKITASSVAVRILI